MDVLLYEYVKGHSIHVYSAPMPVPILLHSTLLHSTPLTGYTEAD